MLAGARERLVGVPQEALGEVHEPRRILGIARAPRIVPAGGAWHLGVLLLTEREIAATGSIVRARHEARRGFTAEAQRARAELEAAAHRGGFAEGQVVHIGWRPIDLGALDAASSPLAVVEGGVGVRWSPRGALAPLDRYLDEQIELLRHPPERA